MKIAKSFQNPKNQSMSLKKIQLRVEKSWTPLFESINKFSDDFMEERKQPQQKNRKKYDKNECSD